MQTQLFCWSGMTDTEHDSHRWARSQIILTRKLRKLCLKLDKAWMQIAQKILKK